MGAGGRPRSRISAPHAVGAARRSGQPRVLLHQEHQPYEQGRHCPGDHRWPSSAWHRPQGEHPVARGWVGGVSAAPWKLKDNDDQACEQRRHAQPHDRCQTIRRLHRAFPCPDGVQSLLGSGGRSRPNGARVRTGRTRSWTAAARSLPDANDRHLGRARRRWSLPDADQGGHLARSTVTDASVADVAASSDGDWNLATVGGHGRDVTAAQG